MENLEASLQEAVKRFWKTRAGQTRRQSLARNASSRDRGARSAVTGGRQMDGFVDLTRGLLERAGVPSVSIFTRERLELPGWFRAEKKWDLVVVHQGELLAAVEFKSQVGPSFGNNFNNRSEEALGSATDLWAAYREGAFRPSAKPWLGYLMLLEDCEASRRAVAVSEPHFDVFPEFRGASYNARYRELMIRLLRDRLYDGASLIVTDIIQGKKGGYHEPEAELTFSRLARSLLARVSAALRD